MYPIKNVPDWYFDVESFDEDGFTLKLISVPHPDILITYIQFKEVTWGDYIKTIICNIINEIIRRKKHA
jgi:hypothetical protein